MACRRRRGIHLFFHKIVLQSFLVFDGFNAASAGAAIAKRNTNKTTTGFFKPKAYRYFVVSASLMML